MTADRTPDGTGAAPEAERRADGTVGESSSALQVRAGERVRTAQEYEEKYGRPDLRTRVAQAICGFQEPCEACREKADAVIPFVEQGPWFVPPSQRPSCPLSGEPCLSWTCLVDVCADATKEQP